MTTSSPILIITGYSGSGKTTISKILEDMGYFCIDNLPLPLFHQFMEIIAKTRSEELEKLAMVVDIRERRLIQGFPDFYNGLREKGLPLSIIFLDATREALILRYKRTRRPHPLSLEDGKTLEEAIDEERAVLEPLKALSSLVINTSYKTPEQLKVILQNNLVIENQEATFYLTVESFGFTHGIPEGSDLVLDVRFLPNPYYIDQFKSRTGKEKEVRDFLFTFPEMWEFMEKTTAYLGYLVEKSRKERFYLTLAVGCTGGRHRSVVVAEELAEHFRQKGYKIHLIHRDITK